ncbi:hypothetical protein ACIF8T_25315 [Streptomyces sp. NPDC085946]|uniref:hypothetical protein n=1 Tax=Streptomyces sp. NPDC085946 TaxID=3365744 RepID=UPI0037D412D4
MTEVPETLKPAVAQLTATLRVAQAPETPPQEKDGVIESTEEITAALEKIDDPSTPADVREELIGITKQVTSALAVLGDPSVPPEEQAMTVLTVQRSMSVLKMISDPATPKEMREDLADSVRNVTLVALRRSRGGADTGTGVRTGIGTGTGEQTGAEIGTDRARRKDLRSEKVVTAALSVTAERETSEDNSKGLAESSSESSSSLNGSTDPRRSEKDRQREKREAEEKIARLEKQVEAVISARGLPNVALGEAAKICTNAVFETVTDSELVEGLTDLAPAKWDSTGVKDYWKSDESGQDSLDVHAQLRNNSIDQAPFGIARLVPELAKSAPADELFGTVGVPALHCLRSALHLHQKGVEAGTWLKMAEQKK